MPWTWVRLADPGVLEGRPLLDVGVGDGQTLAALTSSQGLRIGLDRSTEPLRAARRAGVTSVVCAAADALPFPGRSFETVVAGDLLHHLDDAAAQRVASEIERVLTSSGCLVAWWYAAPGRGGIPAYPRRFEDAARLAESAGLRVTALALDVVAGTPETVGLTGRPG